MIDFERINKGLERVNKKTSNLCRECGGFCEYHEICWFLPGEVEFISQKLKIPVRKFKEKFVTKLKYKKRIIQILKLGKCPFLKKNSCSLEKIGAKPLVCIFYPMYIFVGKNDRVKFILDNKDCPKAKEFPLEFIKNARIAYRKIKKYIPAYWLSFTKKFDALFDYNKLNRLRDKKNNYRKTVRGLH